MAPKAKGLTANQRYALYQWITERLPSLETVATKEAASEASWMLGFEVAHDAFAHLHRIAKEHK